MFDPLTLLMVGAGALAFREMQRKDYGQMTPAREERYRVALETYGPEALLAEAKLFEDHGLKVQGALLRKRAEWRSRTDATKQAHEEIFQRAIKSTNIPGILKVAAAFEELTATKKAAALHERIRVLQEAMLHEAAQQAAEAVRAATEHANGTVPPPSAPSEGPSAQGADSDT